jgi:hypothetical protein
MFPFETRIAVMSALKRFISALSLSVTCALATGQVMAGAADVETSEGGRMKFEYADDGRLRINMPDADSYMLVREGEIYAVTESNGSPQVISLRQAMNMFGGMADSATPSASKGRILKLSPTGESQTYAGISGPVYQLQYIDEDGKEQTTELVLSDDPRALAFRDAMNTMVQSLVQAAGKDADTEAAGDLQRRLQSLDMGVLRYGEDMWVTAISTRSIDAGRFTLPAEPMDLSALGGFGAQQGASGKEEESGGTMSDIMGMFGKKADEKADRAGDKAEQEVDEAADRGIDKAIDKAFGKIFGN